MLSKKDKVYLEIFMDMLNKKNRYYRKKVYKQVLNEYEQIQLLQFNRRYFNACMRVIYKGLGKEYGL